MKKLFKNLKLQDKYLMFLTETYNATEIDSRTSKYKVLKTVDSKGDLYWFLGKSGAVRINRKPSSTTSLDFSNHINTKFKTWESNHE